MNRYQVIIGDGSTSKTVNVPSDRARNKYEYISAYGLEAVLERARRSRAYKQYGEDARVEAIILPNGDEITQF